MNVMIIFGVMLVFVGIYLITQAMKMKKLNELAGNVILSDEEVIKCKDKAGFISYVYEKEVFTGAAICVLGIALAVKELVAAATIICNVVIVLGIIVILWFFNVLREARSKFLY